MSSHFLELTTTPAVRLAQERYYGRAAEDETGSSVDVLGPAEREFIAARDSFYLATVTESGWPYIQHRGGAPGFLQVTGSSSLAFADYRGNRQLLSTGNLAGNDRVALFLMDYPQRSRLKIIGRARVVDAREHPELVARFSAPETHRAVERVFLVEVVGFDWNCPKYITPRYTADEVRELITPLKARITELEAQLKNRP